MKTVFICTVCKQEIAHDSDFTTGYGVNILGEKCCYACCGEIDRQKMIADGKDTMYLTCKNGDWWVSNWPDSLRFHCPVHWTGHHNMCGEVDYARFVGPDNKVWTVKRMGNMDLCRVRRTKLQSILA